MDPTWGTLDTDGVSIAATLAVSSFPSGQLAEPVHPSKKPWQWTHVAPTGEMKIESVMKSMSAPEGRAAEWKAAPTQAINEFSMILTSKSTQVRVRSRSSHLGDLITSTSPLPATPQGDRSALCECHGFGGVLEPRYIVGAGSLDQ